MYVGWKNPNRVISPRPKTNVDVREVHRLMTTGVFHTSYLLNSCTAVLLCFINMTFQERSPHNAGFYDFSPSLPVSSSLPPVLSFVSKCTECFCLSLSPQKASPNARLIPLSVSRCFARRKTRLLLVTAFLFFEVTKGVGFLPP